MFSSVSFRACDCPDLQTQYFEIECTDSDANLHKGSTEQGIKRPPLGVRRSQEFDVSFRGSVEALFSISWG